MFFLINLLFFSLPLEHLLTFDIGGYSLKLSYLVAIFAIICFAREIVKSYKKVCFGKWLLLFVAFSFVSIGFALEMKRAVLIVLLYLMLTLLYYALVLGFLKTRKSFSYWAKILLLIGTLLSLFALWQFGADMLGLGHTFLRQAYTKSVFGFPRPQGTFLEPLYFANFLFLPLFCGYYLISGQPKLVYWLESLLVLIAFFLTLSRGSFLALIFALIILLALALKNKKFRQFGQWFALVCCGFAVTLSIIALSSGKSKNYLEQIGSVSQLSQAQTYQQISGADSVGNSNDLVTLTLRQFTANVALKTIPHHFWGIGSGNFGALPEFKPLLVRGSHQIVNNLYLEIMVENGWLGFLSLMVFLLLLFRAILLKAWQGDAQSSVLLAMAAAVFFQYLFFSTFYLTYIFVLLAMACVTAKNGWRKEVSSE